MNPVCLTLILMETVLLFRINLSNGYVPHLLPVPDMTALVTLRDKPLGGNDSMPMVHVRCQGIACNPSIDFTLTSETFCKKMSSCIAVKINQQDLWISGFPDPDMTTLVTLEVHSPGDNDSVSLVPVRIRLFLKHACALIVGTGDSSLTVYNPDTFVHITDTFYKSYRAFYFTITYCFNVYNPDNRSSKIRYCNLL